MSQLFLGQDKLDGWSDSQGVVDFGRPIFSPVIGSTSLDWGLRQIGPLPRSFIIFLGGAPNRTSRTGQTSVLGIKKWGPIGTSRTSLKKANRSPPT